MSDPLSIAASVAGLLSVGLQSTEYLYQFYTAYREQHRDLTRIVDQLGGLLESLQTIDEIVRTRTWRPFEHSIVQSVERSIARSEDVIYILRDEVKKFEKEPADNWRKKAVVVGRRAAYPFKRSTLEDLGDDVSDFRDNLSVALQALQLKEHQNTQNDIEAVATIVKSIQVKCLSADLRQWLQAPDATIDFNVTSFKRHIGTGQWLIQGPAYKAWLEQDNSFLWLYGFAGCGKSVLCSTAIQHAFRRRQSTANSAAAFFFFTFNDESKQDASGALRALLSQLCSQVSGLEADLAHLKESYNLGTPPVLVLLEYLRQTVARCHHVYILIDAIDESPADGSRAEVLYMIETMRGWQLPSLHLLVTSRDTPDIRDHLQFPTLREGIDHLPLKNDSIEQDISRFVSFQVDHDRQLQRWGNYREKIKNHLTQNAGGVFRWVECQLRPLRQCARSEKHLEKCLRTLPQTLDETYERMLCSVESREEAQQVLSLLCFAARPLAVEEVIEALAVDIDDLECYDPRSRFTGGSDDLLRICPGLIEIGPRSCNHNEDDFRDKDGTDGPNSVKTSVMGASVVRIAHFSVQEYLLSDRIRRSRAAEYSLSGPLQHGRISKACLLYLSRNDFLKQSLSIDYMEHYAFARYAAEHWYHHYRQADNQLVHLSETAVSFLTTRCKLDRWIQVHDPDLMQGFYVDYHESAKICPSAAYYASLLGLDGVLMKILAGSAADVNAQGGDFGNALQAASYNGHTQVVQMLLEKSADVNAEGGPFGNALQAASYIGHEQVVRMLLEQGADVNAQEDWCGGALQAASCNGHTQVVQMLLEKGADVNAEGGRCGNALQAASESGHEKIVQMLLDNGANVNGRGGIYDNAMHAASERGHEKVVQILLSAGADVNAQAGNWGNVLQVALCSKHERVVQTLISFGADVNAQGGKHSNALLAATETGQEKIVQMVLDAGADVNAQGDNKLTALQKASRYGLDGLVQMLLNAGADIHARGGEYGSALHAATEGDHEGLVQTLLDAGADVNAQGEDGGNASQAALAYRHEKVVQILLNAGANIHARGGKYGGALHAASEGGDERLVQTLLDAGADVNAQGEEGGNVLQAASEYNREKIVQMLLNAGANVNPQGGGRESNPLYSAIFASDLKVIQMLLDVGADANARQGGVSMLRAASFANKEGLVQLLLQAGADVDAEEGECKNAL